jgi:hypothetical protein
VHADRLWQQHHDFDIDDELRQHVDEFVEQFEFQLIEFVRVELLGIELFRLQLIGFELFRIELIRVELFGLKLFWLVRQ